MCGEAGGLGANTGVFSCLPGEREAVSMLAQHLMERGYRKPIREETP